MADFPVFLKIAYGCARGFPRVKAQDRLRACGFLKKSEHGFIQSHIFSAIHGI
jgi:hypothetical protein